MSGDSVPLQWIILGTGGDLLSSVCAIEVSGDNFTLTKKAPVISYGEAADNILVTCRRSPDAPASDQVYVMVRRGEYTAEPLSTRNIPELERPIAAYLELSTGAKTMQFQLARAMACKKPLDLSILDQMATTWEVAIGDLKARFS